MNYYNMEKHLVKYCCCYSSFFFLFNVIATYYYNDKLYMYLSLLLFSTSIMYHCNYTNYTYICDKIAIILFVIYGGHILYNKRNNNKIVSMLILTLFISTIYLYYYGYYYNKYVFSKKKIESNLYHSLMHFIASVGHILIVIV